MCELILERRPHPEQGFRSCLGIVRLMRPFGADRVEAAAMRAIEIGTLTYGSMRSILDNKLDRQSAHSRPADTIPVLHPIHPRRTPIGARQVVGMTQDAVKLSNVG